MNTRRKRKREDRWIKPRLSLSTASPPLLPSFRLFLPSCPAQFPSYPPHSPGRAVLYSALGSALDTAPRVSATSNRPTANSDHNSDRHRITYIYARSDIKCNGLFEFQLESDSLSISYEKVFPSISPSPPKRRPSVDRLTTTWTGVLRKERKE